MMPREMLSKFARHGPNNMSHAELDKFIASCLVMEHSKGMDKKSRKAWRETRERAETEKARREQRKVHRGTRWV